jgi:peptidoglycan hydrolase-like protein with peptidoglycan-binding domain
VGAPQQILISPEHYGWIRVLCDTEATPQRIVGVQRQLSAAGVYQGPIDGRYSANTTAAVERFQAERHIEDRGYLSYATLSALSTYSQTSYQQNSYIQGSYAQGGYYQAPNPYPAQSAYAPAYPYAYPQAPPAYGYRPLTTFDTGVLTWPGKR